MQSAFYILSAPLNKSFTSFPWSTKILQTMQSVSFI